MFRIPTVLVGLGLFIVGCPQASTESPPPTPPKESKPSEPRTSPPRADALLPPDSSESSAAKDARPPKKSPDKKQAKMLALLKKTTASAKAAPVRQPKGGMGGQLKGGIGLGSLGTRGSGSGGGGYGIGDMSGVGGLGRAGARTGRFAGREVPKQHAPTQTSKDNLSTFAVDVDTAAYSIARRALNANNLPHPTLVRVEEFLNYFHYDYDPPTTSAFSIQVDGAKSPVDERRHLLRVGIQAQSISDAKRKPFNVVFLVDTSGSMRSRDKLALAKKSLKLAVDRLDDRDRVAITTYAGGVRLILEPTPASQKAVIKKALDGLASGGGTAMESGLTLAYQQALRMKQSGAVTRIIVCSDGDANIGASSHHAIMKRIKGYVSEGVFLSTIGFGDGNYKDETMEQLANRGNGNYFYVDTERQAVRIFSRDFIKMMQDVAKDVKIQVDFEPSSVASYRLIGYENRDVADADFRRDEVDAGEIGAGHQVTALYEITLTDAPGTRLATVRVRAKRPNGHRAQESKRIIETRTVQRSFTRAPQDLRFATAVMGFAELMRQSPHASGWSYDRILSLLEDIETPDADRTELAGLVRTARSLAGSPEVSLR